MYITNAVNLICKYLTYLDIFFHFHFGNIAESRSGGIADNFMRSNETVSKQNKIPQ